MTMQKRDVLQYEDEFVSLYINILNPYFEAFPERLVRTEGFITSLRRGYFAEYVIREKSLYVTSLKRFIGFDREKKELIAESTLDIAFPNTKKCNFFSGWIELNKHSKAAEAGNIKLIEIKNGDFVKELTLSKTEYKTLQETTAYKDFEKKYSFMWY
ncbi:hypothetical protein [Kordia sp.]|uniref:hypothetical protein n=1 Tax=Kordia sp. TaxID=1965332 RepID=UPI003B5C8EC1